MSLLLEALKKAELAKQGRKPADDEASPALAVRFEPAPTERRSAAEPVITRGQLPDISQPLEILSEDLPSATAKRALEGPAAEPMAAAPPPFTSPPDRPARAAEPEIEPMAAGPAAVPLRPPMPPDRPARVAEPEMEPMSNAAQAAPEPMGGAERSAARQLFEAKEVEFNPKRNFYITVGVLLAAGAGYGGYVWWQLQPRSAYSPAAVQNAAKAAPAAQVSQTPVVQPPTPAPAPAALQTPAPPGPAPAAAKAAVAPAQAQAAVPRGPAFARREGGPAATAAAGSPAAARGPEPGGQSPITITPPALAVDPLVERAFESYQRGDLAGSRETYQQVLQREPLNRDALLGLAAIDVRSRSYDTAEARYVKLLELDPRDVNAQAGLMALRGQVDPVQSESRLKTLIASNPEAPSLYFALGNQYAQQARWAEAQAAYFKAYSGDSENADFSFNLAVSLDQLRQKALALQYYQRALALAASRPVSFELTQAHNRIQELQRQ